MRLPSTRGRLKRIQPANGVDFSEMRLYRVLFACLFLLPALSVRAASSAVDAPHVRVELLAPGGDLYPSDKLNDVGIYFKLEPGWHIYWKNPGDAGEAPNLHWT